MSWIDKTYDRIKRQQARDKALEQYQARMQEQAEALARQQMLLSDKHCIYVEEQTKMQKEYEYKAVGHMDITPGNIAKYNPCDTEFGKFIKWVYSRGMNVRPDQAVVEKLVEEKRFGWLDWLAEHTPFVTRTEKKPAYKFTPENLKLEFHRLDGTAYVKMLGTDDEWWYVMEFTPGGTARRPNGCENLPVKMHDGRIIVT